MRLANIVKVDLIWCVGGSRGLGRRPAADGRHGVGSGGSSRDGHRTVIGGGRSPPTRTRRVSRPASAG